MLEALASEFAVLGMSLSTTCTHVGVKKGGQWPSPFVPCPPRFQLLSNMGSSAHAEHLLLWVSCGPGLRGVQGYGSDGQSMPGSQTH